MNPSRRMLLAAMVAPVLGATDVNKEFTFSDTDAAHLVSASYRQRFTSQGYVSQITVKVTNFDYNGPLTFTLEGLATHTSTGIFLMRSLAHPQNPSKDPSLSSKVYSAQMFYGNKAIDYCFEHRNQISTPDLIAKNLKPKDCGIVDLLHENQHSYTHFKAEEQTAVRGLRTALQELYESVVPNESLMNSHFEMHKVIKAMPVIARIFDAYSDGKPNIHVLDSLFLTSP